MTGADGRKSIRRVTTVPLSRPNMNRFIGYALLILFGSWVSLSTVIWIYWHCRHEPYDGFFWRLQHTVVAFGFLFGVFFLLWPGFESSLFWIPLSWTVQSGMDALGEPEWTSLRRDLGGFLAFIASLGLFSLLDVTAKLRRENNELREQVNSAVGSGSGAFAMPTQPKRSQGNSKGYPPLPSPEELARQELKNPAIKLHALRIWSQSASDQQKMSGPSETELIEILRGTSHLKRRG